MPELHQDFYSLINFCGAALFDKKNQNHTQNIEFLLPEAANQTVFPLVYATLEGKCDLSDYQSRYYSVITNNVRIFEEHKKLHQLLSENGVPYVFLKGCASARYYPDPLLRTMGDVDILITPDNTEKVDNLLLSAGYTKYSDSEELDLHIGYKSKTGIVCELHRSVNGIPKTEIGDKISSLLSDIFDKSVLQGGEYVCPDDFHHGLILLLHTATHLTHEGIGLRHLCDWAVFIAQFSDELFLKIFEKPLKNVGLWKFACILSACAVKYLGCPQKQWIEHCDNTITDAVLEDILNGGNFGKKDFSRYQHIKYISNRENRTIDNSHPIKRVFINISSKAKNEIGFVKRFPLLLPIGFLAVIFKYLFLIITRKRKPDSKATITAATKRKNLYSEFKLFEADK